MKFFKKLKDKISRKLTIRKLIRQYEEMLIIEILMEEWVTTRILDGQQGRRQELVEKQKRIKEMELFINWLKKL